MKGLKIILCCLIAIVIGTTIGIILVNLRQKSHKSDVEKTTEPMGEVVFTSEVSTGTTEVGGASTTENMTTRNTTEESTTEEAPTVEDAAQPESLTRALEGMVSYEELQDKQCGQLVVVQASGSNAQITCYQLDAGGLWQNAGLDCAGFVGKNGVSADSYEGSKMTPAGFFPVREAFYFNEVPETGLPSFQVTQNTYWVDDPDSPHYNQWVELDEAGGMEKDFDSAEHMIDYPGSYEYGFVVGFNDDPVVPGKGSAIFFHISTSATLGCIATDRQHVLDILKFLDVNQNPYILIR